MPVENIFKLYVKNSEHVFFHTGTAFKVVLVYPFIKHYVNENYIIMLPDFCIPGELTMLVLPKPMDAQCPWCKKENWKFTSPSVLSSQ